MHSTNDEEEETAADGFKFAAQAIFLGSAPLQRALLGLNSFARTCVYFALLCVLVGTPIGLGVMAYKSANGSFAQSMLVECSAGIAVFLLFPRLLELGKEHGWKLHAPLLLVALVLGFTATRFSGVAQSFLIEGSIGLLLLSGLEWVAQNAIKVATEGRKKAKKEAEESEERVDEAEEKVDFVRGGHGFGEFDERHAYLSDAPAPPNPQETDPKEKEKE